MRFIKAKCCVLGSHQPHGAPQAGPEGLEMSLGVLVTVAGHPQVCPGGQEADGTWILAGMEWPAGLGKGLSPELALLRDPLESWGQL